jgi:hypothetical protein
MAEPTTFPEEHVGESLVYRRISVFAIAGLVLACAFTFLVVIDAAVAFRKKTPVLLPVWVQALAVIGAIVSLVGLVRINRSEGTLAGARMAKWGWWVSVISGLGYWAYYVATYFAITQQAETFTVRYFSKIAQGKFNSAFLDMQPPGVRKTVQPDDEKEMQARFGQMTREGKSPLDLFKERDYMRAITQGGEQTEIRPLGVEKWDYEDGGYKIHRAYQIVTPEGVSDFSVTVLGTESPTREYQGREWQIIHTETTFKGVELTQLGKNIGDHNRQSALFLSEWANKLGRRELPEAYLDTRDPAERKQLRENYLARFVATIAAGVAPADASPVTGCLRWLPALDLGRPLYLPAYDAQFTQGGIIQTPRKLNDVGGKFVLASMRALLGGPSNGSRLMMMAVEQGSAVHLWKIENDRLLLPHDFRVGFQPEQAPAQFAGTGVLWVESEAGAATTMRPQQWRVTSLELLGAEDMLKRGQSAPDGADMPSPPGRAGPRARPNINPP